VTIKDLKDLRDELMWSRGWRGGTGSCETLSGDSRKIEWWVRRMNHEEAGEGCEHDEGY
jgi:hypothetical protein